MKKLFLIMALGFTSLTCSAQFEKVILKPVKEGQAPQALLDSLKKAFPNPIGQTLSAITASNYGQAWNVYVSPASEAAAPMYYEVQVKAQNGRRTLVYDKDGNLIKVKQVVKNAEIPEPVKSTLRTRYADWQVVGNEERITNADKTNIEYKVILKKGLLRKAVFIDPQGEVKVALPTV